jgi:23S rRNA (adenine(2503)-C(2))-methyltransferase
MNIGRLKKILDERSEPSFRLAQILKAVYQDGILDFKQITTLPKEERASLAEDLPILSFQAEKVARANNKRSYKALLKLTDSNFIETVIMEMRANKWTACLSSQVGCPLGCAFCATGQIGFKRNLTSEEITDQVLFWRGFLKASKVAGRLTSIVYMGMGEPFLNWENVRQSIKDLTNNDLFGFGQRSLAISTAGIPAGIKKLAKEFPQINLAISLPTADNKKRSEMMPINQQYNLSSLHSALANYLEVTNRKVFIEYILMADENDNTEEANQLISYIKSFPKSYLMHVNLIIYNQTGGKFKSPANIIIERFKNYLLKNKIKVTVRKSLGAEIKAACGQLAGRE